MSESHEHESAGRENGGSSELGAAQPRAIVVARVRRSRLLLAAIAAIAGLALVAALVWSRREPAASSTRRADTSGASSAARPDEDDEGAAGAVSIDPAALAALHLETEGVTRRSAIAPLAVTGTVEANAEREQQVVSLVSGRLASVDATLGDQVGRGAVLATIQSPEIAELQGQLYEARSKLSLAEANVARVRTSANRAGVIAARAKLDLAGKTLNRKRRLVELGGSPQKELDEAEADYETAKAEYDYQATVALSREVQEAENEREGARATVERLRQQLVTLGANPDGRSGLVAVTAPVSGAVTRRDVNSGAGVQEGTALFTVADTSTVWIVANVPEAFVSMLRVGVAAEVRSAAIGDERRAGRVSYVDPQLDEETRTARVRVELANAGERLKVGMFVEVTFQVYPPSERGVEAVGAPELLVPEVAVQRTGDRTFVFVPDEDEPGRFLVKDVEIGATVNGYARVLHGLHEDDKVVTKGSFELKSKLLKGSFGEDDE